MRFILSLFVIFVMSLSACKELETSVMQQETQKKIETVQGLMSNQPAAKLDWSADRYLLDLRNTRFNDPNKMNYLYIFLLNGDIYEYTIIGKLASTSKRLTSPVMKYKLDAPSGYREVLGPAPDMMGTYGHSGTAKLGMTTLGSLLEFGGFIGYIYSETPLIFKNRTKQVIKVTLQASPEEIKEFEKGLKDYKNKTHK